MYKPIQIPNILNEGFSRHIKYSENIVSGYEEFIICIWNMVPKREGSRVVDNVIVTDGCVDLIVNINEKLIGFAGMSTTEFHFKYQLPNCFLGARMMPGVFNQLTGIHASKVMDEFIPLQHCFSGFDYELFWELSFESKKSYFTDFIKEIISDKKADGYSRLFSELSSDIPANAKELYERLNLSPRQCQRVFLKRYGITPKKVLSILRFQKSLLLLSDEKSYKVNVLEKVNYYDQPHFINDFKRNIGITPYELLDLYSA